MQTQRVTRSQTKKDENQKTQTTEEKLKMERRKCWMLLEDDSTDDPSAIPPELITWFPRAGTKLAKNKSVPKRGIKRKLESEPVPNFASFTVRQCHISYLHMQQMLALLTSELSKFRSADFLRGFSKDLKSRLTEIVNTDTPRINASVVALEIKAKQEGDWEVEDGRKIEECTRDILKQIGSVREIIQEVELFTDVVATSIQLPPSSPSSSSLRLSTTTTTTNVLSVEPPKSPSL